MKNFFLLDDHPLTIDAYKNLLKQEFPEDTEFICAQNGDEVSQKISKMVLDNNILDLAIVDYNIPASEDNSIKNGTDVANLILNHFPKCKIVFLTMHNEPIIVQNLHLKFKPEGIISKNDIDFESFPLIIKDIMNGKFYRSTTMIESLKQLIIRNISFDEIDSQILLLLANKVKNKDLTDHINLSQSAIEKRKQKIKYQILGDKGSDKELIEVAKSFKLI